MKKDNSPRSLHVVSMKLTAAHRALVLNTSRDMSDRLGRTISQGQVLRGLLALLANGTIPRAQVEEAIDKELSAGVRWGKATDRALKRFG